MAPVEGTLPASQVEAVNQSPFSTAVWVAKLEGIAFIKSIWADIRDAEKEHIMIESTSLM